MVLKLKPTYTPILGWTTSIKAKEGIPYFLIINEEGFSACRINKTGKEILEMCNGINSLKSIAAIIARKYNVDLKGCLSDVMKFIEEAYQNGFLFFPNLPQKVGFEYTSITKSSEVWFHITNRCNLKCLTCFKDAGRHYKNEISLSQAKKIIDEIGKLAPDTVVVSGGEPLIHEECLPILKYLKEKGLFIHLITNGTLITKDIAFSLKKIGVDFVQVSLDGSSPYVNDKIRGKGTFKRTMEGVKNLKEASLRFSLYPTITKLNIDDLPNMYRMFPPIADRKSSGCAFFCPIGRGGRNKELLHIPHQEFFNKVIRFLFFEVKLFKKGYDFNFKMEGIPPNLFKRPNCGLGSGTFSIDADGSVYPCQWLHLPKFRAGNVFLKPLREIYYTSPIFQKMRNLRVDTLSLECRKCEIRYLCGGGCRAHALRETGSILKRDPLCCIFKPTFEWGLWGATPQLSEIKPYKEEVGL
ncbi:MAG: PqqD family peptide modification chaperone [candidate division WOR-3 bacterium]